MKAKEFGYVLAIDQASNIAGVSLWHNGELKATTELRSRSPHDPFSRRLQHQLPQLTEFLDLHVPKQFQIETVIFEGVRSRLIMAVVGAFLCCPRIHARMAEKPNFVESSTWKRWARERGATGPFKEIKGISALLQSGFDNSVHRISSEDISDSILIYYAWRDRI